MDVPRWTSSENNRILVSGCNFKFHENLDGFASYVGYDVNQTEIMEVSSVVKKSIDLDTYQFENLVLTSYLTSATYFKCKLYKAGSMPSVSVSDFSLQVPVLSKFI